MSTTNFNTANKEGVDFNATYTPYNQAAAQSATNSPDYPALPFKAGSTVKGSNDSDYVFVLAGSSISVNDVVVVTDSSTWSTEPITTTNGLYGRLVGVANVAIASGNYGWIQRAGRVTSGLNVKALCAVNVQLATTATPGVIDDAITTGLKRISGIIITATNTAATAAAKVGVLNYPVVFTTY